MGDLKDELTKRLNGDTEVARSIKTDLKALLTEDWFNSFIIGNVDNGLIDLSCRKIKVYFTIERQSGLTEHKDIFDKLVYCLKIYKDGIQNYSFMGDTTYNDVYNDTTSAITDKVIKETVENILSGFSDLRDLEIDPLLGIDQAGRYSRIFQIEFKNPVVEQ